MTIVVDANIAITVLDPQHQFHGHIYATNQPLRTLLW